MRLISTTTFKLHEFTSSEIPKCAILSHTWDGQEISDEQLESGLRNDKIKRFCDQARRDGLQFC